MKFENAVTEFGANRIIILFWELPEVIFAKVVAEEAIFQSERMSDLKLFPGDNSAGAYLVRLHLKAAVLKAKHVGFLCENPR